MQPRLDSAASQPPTCRDSRQNYSLWTHSPSTKQRSYWRTRNQTRKSVFTRLRAPNRAWLLGVYAVIPQSLLTLYGIIYVTWYTNLGVMGCRRSDSRLFGFQPPNLPVFDWWATEDISAEAFSMSEPSAWRYLVETAMSIQGHATRWWWYTNHLPKPTGVWVWLLSIYQSCDYWLPCLHTKHLPDMPC